MHDVSGASREPARPVLLREAGSRDLDSFLRCLDVVARERRYLAMVEGPSRAEAEAFLADARARGRCSSSRWRAPKWSAGAT